MRLTSFDLIIENTKVPIFMSLPSQSNIRYRLALSRTRVYAGRPKQLFNHRAA